MVTTFHAGTRDPSPVGEKQHAYPVCLWPKDMSVFFYLCLCGHVGKSEAYDEWEFVRTSCRRISYELMHEALQAEKKAKGNGNNRKGEIDNKSKPNNQGMEV